MIGRRLFLVAGTLMLLGGIVLSVLWVRLPSTPVEVAMQGRTESVLIVTRPIRARALLRIDDLGWVTLPTDDVAAGSYVRGQATPIDFAGAVALRDLRPGDALKADQVVKASEPGFIPAVLGPGMRATSIAVSPAEGTSGLIVPGDRVDVVLTQSFGEAGLPASKRSVGETVLQDLRVIAVDQTTAAVVDPKTKQPEARVAKTITLEVTAQQAEALMVALHLGKIQLTLRNTGDKGAVPAGQVPTWGSDVSPALRSLDGDAKAPGSIAPPAAAGRSGVTVEIMRGGKSELRCFGETGAASTDCGGSGAEPAAPPTSPAGVPAPVTPNRNM
jgi:pilus assembly protein CpaB